MSTLSPTTRDSIVQLVAPFAMPSFTTPWNLSAPFVTQSTGILLSNRKILTCAHNIEHATSISAQRLSHSTAHPARIIAVSLDLDLAVLTVDNDSFWNSASPLRLAATIPSQLSPVLATGFETGSLALAVHAGIVTGTTTLPFYPGAYAIPALVVQSRATHGASGGPLFCGELVAGVIFQAAGSELVLVVPAPIAARFVESVTQGNRSVDSAALGVLVENDPPVIMAVRPTSTARAIVEPGDMVLAVDGCKVTTTMAVRAALARRRLAGDKVGLTVRHASGNKTATYKFTLRPAAVDCVVSTARGRAEFFNVGGMVFGTASAQWLEERFGEEWMESGKGPVHREWVRRDARMLDEQIVILLRILCEGQAEGYGNLMREGTEEEVLQSVNDIPVRNLRQLAAAVDTADEGNDLVLAFRSGRVVVLDRGHGARARDEEVLRENGAPTSARLRRGDATAWVGWTPL